MSTSEKLCDSVNNNNTKHQDKYWAFISYRHSDNKETDRNWASWLHREIEQYEIPAELIGEENAHGEVIPEKIYPVFRDEESLPADADLSNSISNALNRSEFLVVLCSPRAIESQYVAQEIEHFKVNGKGDRIIAGIIAGEPSNKERECFPTPIREIVNPDGKLAEPIAADFRLPDGNEGYTSAEAYRKKLLDSGTVKKQALRIADTYDERLQLMKLKIIAGILGKPLEILRDRDKAYQLAKAKKRQRTLTTIITTVSILAIAAIVAGTFAMNQKKLAEEQKELAEKKTKLAEKNEREMEQALSRGEELVSNMAIRSYNFVEAGQSYLNSLPNRLRKKSSTIVLQAFINLEKATQHIKEAERRYHEMHPKDGALGGDNADGTDYNDHRKWGADLYAETLNTLLLVEDSEDLALLALSKTYSGLVVLFHLDKLINSKKLGKTSEAKETDEVLNLLKKSESYRNRYLTSVISSFSGKVTNLPILTNEINKELYRLNYRIANIYLDRYDFNEAISHLTFSEGYLRSIEVNEPLSEQDKNSRLNDLLDTINFIEANIKYIPKEDAKVHSLAISKGIKGIGNEYLLTVQPSEVIEINLFTNNSSNLRMNFTISPNTNLGDAHRMIPRNRADKKRGYFHLRHLYKNESEGVQTLTIKVWSSPPSTASNPYASVPSLDEKELETSYTFLILGGSNFQPSK